MPTIARGDAVTDASSRQRLDGAATTDGRIKVLDVDLATFEGDVDALAPYESAIALLRWRGRPVGKVGLPVVDGRIAHDDLRRAAAAALGPTLDRLELADRLSLANGGASTPALPSATIVVCTRDRPDDLAACLSRLRDVCPRGARVLVVDNAPSDDRTRRVATAHGVDYVLAPRPGLAWARTRGIEAAETDLVLFTDDDVVVDPGWVDALRRPFLDPDLDGATGLVMPIELETAAQVRFEEHYGFSTRGFERREFDATTISPAATGPVGAGASMAFRRDVLRALRPFATELGPGTAAAAGDDTYALYRVLSHGHRIVYTPDALAWHRHRIDDAGLATQIRGYGTATACVLLRLLFEHGEGDALGLTWWYVRRHFVPRLWRALRHDPAAPPLHLTLAELRGWLAAPAAFVASRRRERAYCRTDPAHALPAT
jgi:GT2 family glycosyltransferase